MFIKHRFLSHTIHPNYSFLPYSIQLPSVLSHIHFQIYKILEILNLHLNLPLIKSFNLHYPSSLEIYAHSHDSKALGNS